LLFALFCVTVYVIEATYGNISSKRLIRKTKSKRPSPNQGMAQIKTNTYKK